MFAMFHVKTGENKHAQLRLNALRKMNGAHLSFFSDLPGKRSLSPRATYSTVSSLWNACLSLLELYAEVDSPLWLLSPGFP